MHTFIPRALQSWPHTFFTILDHLPFLFQLSFPPVSFSGVSVPTLGTWTPPDTNTGASQSLIEKCTIKTKFIKVSYSGLAKCFSREIVSSIMIIMMRYLMYDSSENAG